MFFFSNKRKQSSSNRVSLFGPIREALGCDSRQHPARSRTVLQLEVLEARDLPSGTTPVPQPSPTPPPTLQTVENDMAQMLKDVAKTAIDGGISAVEVLSIPEPPITAALVTAASIYNIATSPDTAQQLNTDVKMLWTHLKNGDGFGGDVLKVGTDVASIAGNNIASLFSDFRTDFNDGINILNDSISAVSSYISHLMQPQTPPTTQPPSSSPTSDASGGGVQDLTPTASTPSSDAPGAGVQCEDRRSRGEERDL